MSDVRDFVMARVSATLERTEGATEALKSVRGYLVVPALFESFEEDFEGSLQDAAELLRAAAVSLEACLDAVGEAESADFSGGEPDGTDDDEDDDSDGTEEE